MGRVLLSSWPLFLGMLLLQSGNALQGSLLGIRAEEAGMDNAIYGIVSSAYFAGFLIGSAVTPYLLRRVGHIRVFAAFGSLASACFILYALQTDAAFWFLLRLVVGLCYSGVYVVAESWINDATTNETRGQALSGYYIVMMVGVVVGQALLNAADPAGFSLFIIMSVLVSLSFAPILLSVSPAPLFEGAQPISLAELYRASPLGFVGQLLLGGFFGAMFGMSPFYAARIDLSALEISIFLSALYVGAVLFQAPIGWLSDRMDRRQLLILVAAACAAACGFAVVAADWTLGAVGAENPFELRLIYLIALLIGGLGNPLYPLLIAHTNDFLPNDRMAAASSALVFLNGIGALLGPIAVGFAMTSLGPAGYWAFMIVVLVGLAVYGLYRSTQRPTVDETSPYAVVGPRAGAIAAEMTQEVVLERIEAAADEEAELTDEDEDDLASREAVDHD